jgi:DNA-binding Lrp family transcriptional regulator
VITAIVLINTEVDRIPEVAEAVAEIPAVREVYSVAGEVDLVAIVRVARHEDLATTIAGAINKTSGVLATTSMIAFQAYSRHDLDAAFSLGD